MSLQQGPQSSAKGKEVAEEIVMVVYSRSGQQFDITAKELANFKWLDKKIDEDPSFKEQVKKKLAKHLIQRYNAYCFHQANVCLKEAAEHKAKAAQAAAEAAQHKANAEKARAEKEQARRSKEAHLAKAAQLDASIKKDEAFIAAEQEKMEKLKKESAVLQQEIDELRSQRVEIYDKMSDCQNKLLFARQEHIKTLTKEAMAQRSGATPPRGLRT